MRGAIESAAPSGQVQQKTNTNDGRRRRTTTTTDDDDGTDDGTDDDDDDDGRRRRTTTTTDDDDGRRTTTTTTTTTDDDDGKISKNTFKLCHHIDFNTTNPNPILKTTIPFTKTPKKPKHFRTKRKSENFKNPTFSKTQTFILHSLHVPQFIFLFICLTYWVF